jgi:hypothetical protein
MINNHQISGYGCSYRHFFLLALLLGCKILDIALESIRSLKDQIKQMKKSPVMITRFSEEADKGA